MVNWRVDMNVIETDIPGVKIIEPQVIGDSRGWFAEQYNAERYKAAGIDADFVQDNESFSSKGVVRGLHWQAAPHTQAKLVRVVRGSVWDVAVDIRKGSPTYGRHVAVTLSAENHRQFFIPRGFAHGFIVLEDDTLFSYKCDRLYCREADSGMLFSDPALGIEWPDLGMELKLSEKDTKHPLFKDIEPWEEK
jgi:dTDP-4-dehydrorhamnose 3,5-epimerase